MKKTILTTACAFLLFGGFFLLDTQEAEAQTPPPPPRYRTQVCSDGDKVWSACPKFDMSGPCDRIQKCGGQDQ